jgi:hypothetical protein
MKTHRMTIVYMAVQKIEWKYLIIKCVTQIVVCIIFFALWLFSMGGGRGRATQDAKANRVTNLSWHGSKLFALNFKFFYLE